MAAKERVELKEPVEVELPDGSVFLLKVGPRGRGVSLVPVAWPENGNRAGGRGRGRPPRPSTIELRAMLTKDSKGPGLKEPKHYIDWLVSKEPKASRATLQQTVYREMQVVGGRPKRRSSRKGGPGRSPHPATVLLREKLERDAKSLQEPAAYVRWLVDKAGIGIRKARPIVYRELRALKA